MCEGGAKIRVATDQCLRACFQRVGFQNTREVQGQLDRVRIGGLPVVHGMKEQTLLQRR